MSRIKIHRPSPALVVAMLALLVALSGTAYAAAMLPKNSVGTAQIKKGAVTLTKIASSAQGSLKPRAWASVEERNDPRQQRIHGDAVGHTNDGIFDFTLKQAGDKLRRDRLREPERRAHRRRHRAGEHHQRNETAA